MINSIHNLSEETAKDLLNEFLDIYLGKGFGIMNKTEIETLLYYIFRKYGILNGKCFDDSLKLQIPESKARKLIYEAQVKYHNHSEVEFDRFLRTSIGECLKNAYLVKNNKEIRFAIEDKYLRVALNAKLRANYFFADTSFNKDIISLDKEAFIKMVSLLVPNTQKELVMEKLKAVELSEETKNKDTRGIIADFIQKVMEESVLEGLKQLGSLLGSIV